jgi:hypothetical protein
VRAPARAVLLLLASLCLAAPALAEEGPPLWGRPPGWYAGWTLITVGGAAALVGPALTTQTPAAGGGLSPTQIAGWVTLTAGTATWVAGTLVLKLTSRRTAPAPR